MRCTRLCLSGFFALTALLGGCGSDSSDADNGGLSPILDEATGWERIKSIAPSGLPAIGRTMEIKTMTRVAGTFAFVDVETRGSQGGPLVDGYYVRFAADAPGDITSTELGIGESYDYKNYRDVFRPGTLDVYQAFRENRGSEVYSGLRTTGPVTVAEVRSGGGDTFAGLADVYEDGSALITGTDLKGVLFRDGVTTRIYGRISDINEPQPLAGYGVELADHTLAWALTRAPDIAIGRLAQNPTQPNDPSQQQIKGIVSIPVPDECYASRLYARAFGNQVVFVNASEAANAWKLCAFRWTEDATTIETLYTNVMVPPSILLPAVANNEPFRWDLDVNAQLTFFNNENTAMPTAGLYHVDATGPHLVSTISGEGQLVQGPWVIDGAIYAGVGAVSRQDRDAQLDLVQLKQ